MENRRRRNLLLQSSLILAGASCLVIFSVTVLPLWRTPSALPNVAFLMSPELLDRHGLPIQVPLNNREERGLHIALSEIPPELQQAFLLAEDKRFYQHKGVDLMAVLRAAYQSLKGLQFVSGASTITMQLARIYWPHLAKPQNKLAQMIQALRIEARHSKQEILLHYFNVIPFAHQVIGVRQACLYFFNKSCTRISLAETATLAILPRNPDHYLNNRSSLLVARNSLLDKLFQSIHVDALLASQSLMEPIKFNHGDVTPAAFHFVHKVLGDTSLEFGSKVSTTLNLHLQKNTQKLFREHVEKNKGLGDAGAILIVENRTGDVLSYIGSPGYFASKHGMLDAVQVLRSPGSALKPFVYAYALEKGWTLSSIVPDVPIKFKVANGVFYPNNYGGTFSGPQQVRFALANSRNIPALFLTSQLGEASVLSFLRKAGFASLSQPSEHYGVGISLGNGEVSLWELVQAYSSLARGGLFKPLRISPSQVLESEKRTMSQETAYLITDVLSDPQARAEEFGRGGSLEFDFKVAAKTGTSGNYRDHWVVGYTSKFTVGLWKGNANGKPLKSHVPASQGAGLLFKEVMKLVHAQNTPSRTRIPQSIVPKRVCSLSGQLATNNCAHSRLELFSQNHTPADSCEYHKQKVVADCKGQPRSIQYVDLPEEYLPWGKSVHLPTLATALQDECGWNKEQISFYQTAKEPKIVEPVSGTVLAIDPTIPSSHQKLRIRFAHPIEDTQAELLVNGQPFTKVKGQTFVDWPLTKGQHLFQVQSSKKALSNKVSVRVF